MKKLSYTTILAAACLLLPGCSDDATMDSFEPVVTPPASELVADSEVLIKLSSSSSSMATRAEGYNDANGLFNTSGYTGIFCLAEDKLPQAEGIANDINWLRSKEDPDADDMVMFNVSSKVKAGNIVWDGLHYYPFSNWYKYRFYGYHTLNSDNESIEVTPSNITVPLTFTGKDDILWGKSEDNTDTQSSYAYSAKYYREHIKASTEAEIPNMEFKHMMTRLEFSVKGCDAAAYNYKVDGITLLDAPKNLRLIVADRENEEGFVISDENSDETVDVPLTDYLIGMSITDVEKTIKSEEYPYAFYVIPEKMHKFRIELRGLDPYVVNVSLPNFKEDQTTYAGHKYKLQLQIYGPQTIGMTATLVDWEYEEGTHDIPVEL
ncbi:MAG: fimbrillin family protein [Bacteroidaceae bacterium]|nr:fimbrillin family protein [Bacteroidaceae bacterium]